jgi:hypothetical protein
MGMHILFTTNVFKNIKQYLGFTWLHDRKPNVGPKQDKVYFSHFMKLQRCHLWKVSSHRLSCPGSWQNEEWWRVGKGTAPPS